MSIPVIITLHKCEQHVLWVGMMCGSAHTYRGECMASGGRPPHSAPSLPLHSSPSAPLESLQTPDTSSLFLSSLGSQAGARTAADFSSLEDLLNYTGISSQPSSPSLETLAQHLEQKQG